MIAIIIYLEYSMCYIYIERMDSPTVDAHRGFAEYVFWYEHYFISGFFFKKVLVIKWTGCLGACPQPNKINIKGSGCLGDCPQIKI